MNMYHELDFCCASWGVLTKSPTFLSSVISERGMSMVTCRIGYVLHPVRVMYVSIIATRQLHPVLRMLALSKYGLCTLPHSSMVEFWQILMASSIQ